MHCDYPRILMDENGKFFMVYQQVAPASHVLHQPYDPNQTFAYICLNFQSLNILYEYLITNVTSIFRT